MIFSNKIYKLEDGLNHSMLINDDKLFISFYYKSTNLYAFSLNNLLNCVFSKCYNYHKLIKINNNQTCLCFNNDMRIVNNNEDF